MCIRDSNDKEAAEMLKNRIHSYQFVNEHILTVWYKTIREYTILVAVYSPEDGCREDSEEFYRIFKVVNKINMNDYVIITEDFNACVVNSPIRNIMECHGEEQKMEMDNALSILPHSKILG